MLQAARTLRVEREKEHTLAQQKLEQKIQVSSSKISFILNCDSLGIFLTFQLEPF